ncbi:MAG: hypothetical protein K0S33_3359 [Bacteroidetes bacterium]|jgi:hypothetical protein|nr:hypothetical protein [Bacteroidota bacterium]
MATLKRKLACILFLFTACHSYSQLFDNTVYNRKSAYAELFGTGLGATVNFEYLFKDYGMKQGIRGGPGYFVNFLEDNSPTIISGNIEYLSFAGARNHHIEWGLGASYQYKYYKKTFQTPVYYIENSDTTILYTDHDYKYQRTGPAIVPRLGYRYENEDGGLVVRVAWTPIIYILNSEKEFIDGNRTSKTAIPFSTKLGWGGISIGFSFY